MQGTEIAKHPFSNFKFNLLKVKVNTIFIICKYFLPQINKSEKPESCDNVKVVVRCRPLNEREKSMCYKQAVSVDEMRGTITVHKTDSSNEPPKTFTFDTVFGPESKQLDVYNLTARPIIDSVLEGYNGEYFKQLDQLFTFPSEFTLCNCTIKLYSVMTCSKYIQLRNHPHNLVLSPPNFFYVRLQSHTQAVIDLCSV